MFLPGNAAARRKVDLGGRSSSRVQDRRQLLDTARVERERRHRSRLEARSALVIQRCWRGRRAAERERDQMRLDWQQVYGEFGNRADRSALQEQSAFLPQLLFFCRPSNKGDVARLTAACRLTLGALHAESSRAFCTKPYPEVEGLVNCQVTRLALLCLQSLDLQRVAAKGELLRTWRSHELGEGDENGAAVLVDALLALTSRQPWASHLLRFLDKGGMFGHLRNLVLLQALDDTPNMELEVDVTVVEHAMLLLAARYVLEIEQGQHKEPGGQIALRDDIPMQIMSIPFLRWQQFPPREEELWTRLWRYSVYRLNNSLPEINQALPPSTSPDVPSGACLLGNLVSMCGLVFSRGLSTASLTVEATMFAVIAVHLLEGVQAQISAPGESSFDGPIWDDSIETVALRQLNPALEGQLSQLGSPEVLHHLVFNAVPDTPVGQLSLGAFRSNPEKKWKSDSIVALCALLHTSMTLFPKQRSHILTALAYSANLVPRLWRHMRACHLGQCWPTCQQLEGSYVDGELGHLLPLAVFCPVYSYMLLTVDNEEFYEQQKPLAHEDLRLLIVILKEAVWQLLWVESTRYEPAGTNKQLHHQSKPIGPPPATLPLTALSVQALKRHVSTVAARLLAELHDRNSRREFAKPEEFHARADVDENFVTQVGGAASEILKKAPFLIPFTDRVRIYIMQLEESRARESEARAPLRRGLRLNIRRNAIVLDSYHQLHNQPANILRGTIRIQYTNELGAEEVGVDGGGLFKDWVENITKTAFDVQYGLFKETSDHRLYPNPASYQVPDHLNYFDFLGSILGKAMYEGILVDIPFATFFLSKLRNKYNYLHDLPSLDPELYHSLLFLKHYDGNIEDLGLYFVVENNEFGERMETDLIPNGRNVPVTSENRIRYIWLVANHRLNTQIRQQSAAFLQGFQRLIEPDWMAMFDEHELQILISGSRDGWDSADLCQNTNYAGGYHQNHWVIGWFWEVVDKMDSQLRGKLLKFVTGCSRGPLLGFKHLEPAFCIQRASADETADGPMDRLPTAATCMNLLKLPAYKSKENLEDKLLYAINAAAGFDLS